MSIINSLHKTLLPQGRYLVAISGGPDSVCLLHSVASLKDELQLEVHAAHVNHKLRDQADADEKFVRTLCDSLGVTLHVFAVEEGSAPRVNIEAWGRAVRYKFFREILDRFSLLATLTAHSANDVIETFLMRLLTNKELNTIHESDDVLRVIRPFLKIWRSEIEEYISVNGLLPVTDLTNNDTKFLRNRIRGDLIPFLNDKFDGDISRIIFDQTQAVREDTEALGEIIKIIEAKITVFEFGSRDWLRVLKQQLETQPPALQWRLVDQLLRPVLHYGIGRIVGKRVVEFILGVAPGLEIPGKVTLKRKDGGIIVNNTES